MAETCENCTHWSMSSTRITRSDGSEYFYGKCGKGVGAVCSLPPADGCVGDGYVEACSGCGRTGPNFGCVHFAPKKPEAKPVGAKTCRTCRWWCYPKDDLIRPAECRRQAPSYKAASEGFPALSAVWPDTEAEDWCGRWEKK